MMKTNRRVAAFGLLMTPFLAVHAQAHDDTEHIVALMKSMFDTPDNPLAVAPVVVRVDNAIAGWSQGDKGGRALLWRKDGAWQIRLCSGAGLKDPKMLEGAGISTEDAKAMTDQLIAEEAKLDQAVVAKYNLFEGIVEMSGEAGQGGHGAHKHSTETQSQ